MNQRKAKRGEDHTQKCFNAHFLIQNLNGRMNDIEIMFIDKTDPLDSTRREEFWQAKLNTLAPNGIYIEE